MRAKMKRLPETTLERLLEALERELVTATDAEIIEAANDLGMQPHMKGSAAFLGLLYPMRPRFQDFFAAAVGKGRIGALTDTSPRQPAPLPDPDDEKE
jgi:hypothetical protein